MAVFSRFEDIDAWKKGRVLVNRIYRLTHEREFAKDFGLKDQIQRAAVSVCSNIAEGYARRGNKELIKFLWIARGSTAEVCSQLYHAKDLGYANESIHKELYELATIISAELLSLIKALSRNLEYTKV